MKPFFVALLGVFLLGCKEENSGVQWLSIADKSPVFKMSIDAIVQQDDSLCVYYTTDGSINFSQQSLVWAQVKGSTESQKIVFELPSNVFPSQLRIDLGKNQRQSPMRLEKVWLSYRGQTVVLPGTLIFSYFAPDFKKTKVDATNGWVQGVVKEGKWQSPSLYPKDGPLGRMLVELANKQP